MPITPIPKPQPLRARKAAPLKGMRPVPGDKSISQRALILGALAEGETRISGLLEVRGCAQSRPKPCAALGAEVTREGAGRWRVTGRGRRRLAEPGRVLDFGNSGTGSRLVMGAMATTPITRGVHRRRLSALAAHGAGARAADALRRHV